MHIGIIVCDGDSLYQVGSISGGTSLKMCLCILVLNERKSVLLYDHFKERRNTIKKLCIFGYHAYAYFNLLVSGFVH